MQITPILSTNYHYQNNRKIKSQPNFTANVDLNKYKICKTSCFFRRGAVVLASDRYNDIENTFNTIFKNNDRKKEMLIIGIGRSQEPFSYLASIKGVLDNRTLKDNLDLHTIDLQSKPELKDLKQNAFADLYDYQYLPKFARKSFVKDSYKNWLDEKKEDPIHYYPIKYLIYLKQATPENKYDRVNDEVFDFLKTTYDNPKKSKWESPVQEVITEYPKDKFNIISANNVLNYIDNDNEFISTVKNINRILKPNGYFITDPYEFEPCLIKSGAVDNLKEIQKGIYQKIV